MHHTSEVKNTRRKLLSAIVGLTAGLAVVGPALRGQTLSIPPASQTNSTVTANSAPATNAVPTAVRNIDLLVARYAKQLNLTAAQQGQIREILRASEKQRAALRKDTALSQQERREQSAALRKTANGQIRDLLTDAQKAKWDVMQRRRSRPTI